MRNTSNILVILSLALELVFAWDPDIRLTSDPAVSEVPRIAVDAYNGDVHVAWLDTRNGQSEVYYKHSFDSGSTWSADFRASMMSDTCTRAAVAALNGRVYIVWNTRRGTSKAILCRASADRGVTWGLPSTVSSHADVNLSPNLDLTTGTNWLQLHLVFERYEWIPPDNYWRIYYTRSTDGGATWGSPRPLLNLHNNCYQPGICSGNALHVVFEDANAIVHTRSTDFGTSWFAAESLGGGPNARTRGQPSVCYSYADPNYVHLTWGERSRGDTFKLCYTRSTSNGANWEPPKILNSWVGDGSHRQPLPSTCTDNRGEVRVVWASYEYGGGNTEIMHIESTNNGSSWGSVSRLTNDVNTSRDPKIGSSFDGRYAHVVWSDSRDGNYEIYYKRDRRSSIEENPVGKAIRPQHRSTISPNITNSILFVHGNDRSHYDLYNSSGEKVQTMRSISGTLDLRTLEPGIYFVRPADSNSTVYKIIKLP